MHYYVGHTDRKMLMLKKTDRLKRANARISLVKTPLTGHLDVFLVFLNVA